MEGVNVGEALGIGNVGINVTSSDKLDDLIRRVKPFVIVDFSTPKATVEVVKRGAKYGVNFVIGTTGHSPLQMNEIKGIVRNHSVSAVISANMTVTGNLLFKLAGSAAKTLGEDYDIDIVEWLDRHLEKIPLPTHTALTIGENIAEALGKDLHKIAVFGREKDLHKVLEERPRGQICFHSIRAGSGAFFGEFQVIFAGPWKKIIIISRFDSMEAVAGGTMKAIRFIYEKSKPGEVYDMKDVLGLR
jgi:4-hydroxy-tetrahydrodipicolinate reductase